MRAIGALVVTALLAGCTVAPPYGTYSAGNVPLVAGTESGSVPVPLAPPSAGLGRRGSQTPASGFSAVINTPRTARCVPGGVSINRLITAIEKVESSYNYLNATYAFKPYPAVQTWYGTAVGIMQDFETQKAIYNLPTFEAMVRRIGSGGRISGTRTYAFEGNMTPGTDTRNAAGASTSVRTDEGAVIYLRKAQQLFTAVLPRLSPTERPTSPFSIFDRSHQEIVGLGELLLDKGLERNIFYAVKRYNGAGPAAEAYAYKVLGQFLTSTQIECLRLSGV